MAEEQTHELGEYATATLRRAENEFFIRVDTIKEAIGVFRLAEDRVQELKERLETDENRGLLEKEIQKARKEANRIGKICRLELQKFEASCEELECCDANCEQAGKILSRICNCFIDGDWPQRLNNEDLVVKIQHRVVDVGKGLLKRSRCLVKPN